MYQVVGQSYSVGYGVEAGKGAAQRLGAFFGEEEQNFGVVGAVLYYSKVAGGYATVANKLVRNSGTYERGCINGTFWFCGNDIFCMGNPFDAGSQAHLKSTVRFGISRMCAGRIFDDEDTAITYSGFSKSAELGESKVTGKFTHFATANGSTVTIDLTKKFPEGFPGGTVAVYLNGENATGATWTFKVDGVPSGELSTKYNYGVTALSMFCHRFVDLPAGTKKIVCTANSITTYAAFDSWAIEAPVPPTVIVPGQFKLNSYGSGETHTPNDADIEALEKLIREACEEFGSNVKFVSLASMDHTTHVQADNLHPTAQGHEEIFALMVAALEEEGPPEEHSGASSISGGGSLSSSGKKVAKGTGTVSAGGALASQGSKGAAGESTVSGGGDVSSAGAKLAATDSSLSGSGTLSSDGSKLGGGTSSLSGGGETSSTGSREAFGTSAISGGGSLGSSGGKAGGATSSISGGGSPSSSGSKRAGGSSSLSGGGEASSSGSKKTEATSSVSGGGNLSSTGSGGESVGGTSSISGGGSLLSSGVKRARAASSMSVAGSVPASGFKLGTGTGTLSGGGSIITDGSAVENLTSAISGGLATVSDRPLADALISDRATATATTREGSHG